MASPQKLLALVSTSNRENLPWFATQLYEFGYEIVASGGTAACLRSNYIPVVDVSQITRHREMLAGRVKTLHPAIHSGILARNCPEDLQEMVEFGYQFFDVVVCNLYPFEEIAKRGIKIDDAIEQIDIGGVTLLRAAAKNYQRVTAVCDPNDYQRICSEIEASQENRTTLGLRKELALKALNTTAAYDFAISNYLRYEFKAGTSQMDLRYGMNSHQKEAQIFTFSDVLPVATLNGKPSFINMLDALNSWQLVQELRNISSLPAAASFKHVSPAGAAVAVPLSSAEVLSSMVKGFELTAQATAYARARSADRLSSFGDWIALSDICDIATAKLICADISDGVIAPEYHPDALAMLKKKKSGKFIILTMNSSYRPSIKEYRTVFGLHLQQERNNSVINREALSDILTRAKDLPSSAILDLLVATIAVKYAQSNSVCYACNGQIIGLGAGQQSRIHCVRLAGEKAKLWWLRQHPYLATAQFKNYVQRSEMNNIIDVYVRGTLDIDIPKTDWESYWEKEPQELSMDERQKWLSKLGQLSMSSDAFFPFRDSINFASTIGVQYIATPMGSTRDDDIISACNDKNIVLTRLPERLFHH
ncbi:uncharacterized protein TRIADDRAFT_60868 [Trichoplax adhaerens]|uniref:Bifunctional purine biosynthesis protein ATIC n=1 Tax=Trichoplax adhaerens TaxID=10228 RepID=B3S9D6_TRIAD|nr:hypothetical protein TRIADDRAFT_60868 [Trichoplax adhaerens]EDV20683.1 hypothetical protein TRIADDRAFT_60868 [Trichoplax adhaerens]|eukprot:XP_002116883.1 hypothetical protein TRIADDRAFT_60868 [Trichoplax adhaerens]